METSAIRQTIERHYKSARVSSCSLNGDGTLKLIMEIKPNLYARVAQRILNTYPDIKMVLMEGSFIETAYTRGSLKRAGFKISEKPKPVKQEPDYDKVFTNGESELCRADLESLPCPFDTKNVTDETMQAIVDELESEMGEWREWNRNGDVTDDKVDEVWWEKLERIVVAHEIPYYEDEEEETEIKVGDTVDWYDSEEEETKRMKVTLVNGEILTLNDGFTETEVLIGEVTKV